MKRLLCVLFAAVSLLSYGQQTGTRDLNVSVGALTGNDLINVVSEIVVIGASLGNITYDNNTGSPAIVIDYKLAVKNNWFLFADGVYQSFGKDIFVSGSAVGKVRDTFVTIGLGTEYHYVHGSWFQMYSGVSLAYTREFSNYTGSSNDISDSGNGFMSLQVNALGFRFGKKLAAFTEFGYGYKGIASLGLSFQF